MSAGKLISAFLFVFVLSFVLPSFAQPAMKSSQEVDNLIVQPTKSVRGDSLKSQSNFAANAWAPIHNAKLLKSCRGAMLLTSGARGYLAVHLTGDPAGVPYKLDLNNDGSLVGGEFDAVYDSTKGTTVKLDTNLFIFPGQYKQ